MGSSCCLHARFMFDVMREKFPSQWNGKYLILSSFDALVLNADFHGSLLLIFINQNWGLFSVSLSCGTCNSLYNHWFLFEFATRL